MLITIEAFPFLNRNEGEEDGLREAEGRSWGLGRRVRGNSGVAVKINE